MPAANIPQNVAKPKQCAIVNQLPVANAIVQNNVPEPQQNKMLENEKPVLRDAFSIKKPLISDSSDEVI